MYREETGEMELDPEKVAPWMHSKGVPLPIPPSPMKLLEASIVQAWREEVRYDKKTRLPYRANHAVPMGLTKHGKSYVWIDIDSADRNRMFKALQKRREGIVDDAIGLELDKDHWNSVHPKDEPNALQMDFALDVEWRKNSMPRRGRTA
ncbi:MAG TPA: hypothetical protein VEZ14_03640 [Dehalococcoidia bacterium]|nr:hypothetical protein [Dehalococcoidia bacterium]